MSVADGNSVDQLRRKASAAKSLLSRYENQRVWASRRTGVTIQELNDLQSKVEQQTAVFRNAVREWKHAKESINAN